MMKRDNTLNEIPLNQKAYIKELNCKGNIRRRLLDLGLVKGASITPVLDSPTHNPRAFFIRGTLIAIRNEDANLIKVTL